jgi:hypothetical protein
MAGGTWVCSIALEAESRACPKWLAAIPKFLKSPDLFVHDFSPRLVFFSTSSTSSLQKSTPSYLLLFVAVDLCSAPSPLKIFVPVKKT